MSPWRHRSTRCGPSKSHRHPRESGGPGRATERSPWFPDRARLRSLVRDDGWGKVRTLRRRRVQRLFLGGEEVAPEDFAVALEVVAAVGGEEEGAALPVEAGDSVPRQARLVVVHEVQVEIGRAHV